MSNPGSTEVADHPYNVLPSDYGSHLEIARQRDLVLWENHGWGVRSIEGDGDTLVWVAGYQLRARQGRPFIKPEFSALQSMIAHVEYTEAQRSRMNDNEFVAIGWNGMDDLRESSALNIAVESEKAVWSMDDMAFTAAPPEWMVQGRQRDIAYDLKLHAESPAFWLTDRRLSALEHGDRWHLVNAKADGRITVGSKEIAVNGMGWHERHIHLNDFYDPVKLLQGPGIVFHNGYARGMDVHVMGRPQLGILRAKILCEGEEINFQGPGAVSVTEGEQWIDPQSRLSGPVTWRLKCQDTKNLLELEVRAFARTFYLWNFLTGGVNVLYWWLAESRGRLERAGRAAVPIEKMKHVVHQNQLLYRYA